MPILERSTCRSPMPDVVREIRCDVPWERCDEVRSFYCDTLDLDAWPPAAQLPGCLCYGPVQRGILLQIVHTEPHVDLVRRRFTLVVESLDRIARRLVSRGWEFERVRGFFASDDRIVVADPLGRRIEIRESRLL
ncbi:MAG: hypothetical protein HZB38_08520 [Planctomycetes bacterium]|nr:hypothetical protein [Planctomycetota bacterium]